MYIHVRHMLYSLVMWMIYGNESVRDAMVMRALDHVADCGHAMLRPRAKIRQESSKYGLSREHLAINSIVRFGVNFNLGPPSLVRPAMPKRLARLLQVKVGFLLNKTIIIRTICCSAEKKIVTVKPIDKKSHDFG